MVVLVELVDMDIHGILEILAILSILIFEAGPDGWSAVLDGGNLPKVGGFESFAQGFECKVVASVPSCNATLTFGSSFSMIVTIFISSTLEGLRKL